MLKLNWVDKIANQISPEWGTRRMVKRAQQQQLLNQWRKYEGASKGRRTENWKAPTSSAPAEIQRALSELRNRSRDLVRNNPYAKRAVRKIATNVVGTGIIPTPKGVSKLQEKKIKQLWKKWADKIVCDYDGHATFYGIEKLVMRAVAESGECIIRKRIVNDPSLPLPLQLQVLEGDFIDTTKHGPLKDGGYIFYGIEFSKAGKVVAYWLYEQHPGDSFAFNYNFESHRFGVEEIIHIFEKERPGQFRGVPMGYASMIRLKDLDEYEDAQLVRQKIAACFTLFVSDASGAASVGITSDDDDFIERVEPGIIETLPPGKQINSFTPPGVEGYDSYTKNVLRGVGAGYDLDYVTLTGDLSSVNFSSGRMGWLDFHRSIQDWQWNMLIPMFCEKAWGWFTQMAGVYGLIKAGDSLEVEWSTPRREQINPETETKAIIEQVQNGLISWEDAILEAGYNPEDQLEKMIRNRIAFEKAGLPNYADKAAMSAKEQAPPQAQKEKKPGEEDANDES